MPKSKPRLWRKPNQKVWYVAYRCQYAKQTRYISTGCYTEANARRKLLEFWNLFDAGDVGPGFSFINQEREEVEEYIHQQEEHEQQQQQLLIEHVLPLFIEDLEAGEIRRGKIRPVCDEHVRTTRQKLERLLAGITRVDEITAELIKRKIDNLKQAPNGKARKKSPTNKPISRRSKLHYQTAIKSFTAWLHRTGRLPNDPLIGMRRIHVANNEVIHNRHAFSPEEIRKILDTTREKNKTRRKFTGQERALLYEFCYATGFRLAEAAAIRKKDFAADVSYVHIEPQFAKSGKAADQPVPEWLNLELMEYLSKLSREDWLWPGAWILEDGHWRKVGWAADKGAGKFLRDDAKDAGIKTGRKAAEQNGGRVLDFHSFRHSFGLSLRGLRKDLQMRLLRTESEQVWRTYAHPDDIEDLQERIDAVNSRAWKQSP